MAAPPLFSVVLTSYNQRETLEGALASVLEQSVRSVEAIVVDDGSSDGSPELAREWAARDPRVRVHTPPRTGRPSAVRNAGIALARGRYLCFLDGDDLYAAGRLATVGAAFERYPDAGVVFGDFRPFGTPKWDRIPTGYLEHLGIPERLREHAEAEGEDGTLYLRRSVVDAFLAHHFAAFTLNVTVRTSLVRRLGLHFDETLLVAEDHDFCMRALLAERAAYVPAVIGHYRKYDGTLSSRAEPRMFADNMEVLRRNLERVGELASPLAHARVRALLAENALELGYGQYWAGDARAARRAYWQALRYTPSLRVALALAKTAVPPRVARRLGRAPAPDGR